MKGCTEWPRHKKFEAPSASMCSRELQTDFMQRDSQYIMYQFVVSDTNHATYLKTNIQKIFLLTMHECVTCMYMLPQYTHSPLFYTHV